MADMKQFKVVSAKMPRFKHGDVVSESDLADANIQALLDGGHLAEVGSKQSKSDKQPKVEE